MFLSILTLKIEKIRLLPFVYFLRLKNVKQMEEMKLNAVKPLPAETARSGFKILRINRKLYLYINPYYRSFAVKPLNYPIFWITLHT